MSSSASSTAGSQPLHGGSLAASQIFSRFKLSAEHSKVPPPRRRVDSSGCRPSEPRRAAALPPTIHLLYYTILPGDNASSIKSETSGSDNDGSKHVDVMAHYVRERMRAGDLHHTYVSTNENIADCMTKNNYYPAFKKFRAAMGVA